MESTATAGRLKSPASCRDTAAKPWDCLLWLSPALGAAIVLASLGVGFAETGSSQVVGQLGGGSSGEAYAAASAAYVEALSAYQQRLAAEEPFTRHLPAVTGLLGALAGVFALLLSPRIARWQIKSQQQSIQASVEIAQKQIHAQVVSANRQAWINTLRDSIAEYLGLASGMYLKLPRKRENETGDEAKPSLELLMEEKASLKESAVYIERLAGLRHKIELLLNPEEDDHQELVGLLNDVLWAVEEHKIDKLKSLSEATVREAGIVLKREWEVVKRGG